MKKTNRFLTAVATFFVSMTFISIAAPQALALKIDVDSYGVAHFYQDLVLGKNDDLGKKEQDGDNQRGGDSKKEYENAKEYEDEPFRSSSLENKSLRLEPKKDEVRVEIREKNNQNIDRESDKFERIETMSTKRLEITTPSSGNEAQKKAAEIRRETAKQDAEKKAQEKKEIKERVEAKKQVMVKNKEEYLKKIQEQRGERQGELLEIKNEYNERAEKQEIQFKSRDIVAKVKDGAQLSYDPETNEVSVVAPSGEEKTLSHLPDQALARMQEAGLISGVNVDELEIKTDSQGNVVYKASIEKNKKFLGLFPRKVQTQIEMDDSSGNLYEMENESESAWGRFIDALSI